MRYDVSTPLNRACEWRIFAQRSVRSDFVVMARIGLQHPAQVRLAEYDHVVDAFTTDRPDQSFGECVLPRRAWGNRLVTDAVPVGNLGSEILVMQSAQNWRRQR